MCMSTAVIRLQNMFLVRVFVIYNQADIENFCKSAEQTIRNLHPRECQMKLTQLEANLMARLKVTKELWAPISVCQLFVYFTYFM